MSTMTLLPPFERATWDWHHKGDLEAYRRSDESILRDESARATLTGFVERVVGPGYVFLAERQPLNQLNKSN